jgi:hypothetical protein
MSELVNLLTLEATQLEQNSDDLPEYRDRAAGLAASYRLPSKQFDDLALNLLTTANAAKVSALSFGGNTGLSTACYTVDTSWITSTYGSLVESVGIASGSAVGIVGLGSDPVAYGVIKSDVLEAFTYPKVDSLDVSVENPFEGEGYVTVTSGNSGIGKDTRYVINGGSTLGNVYAVSVAGACGGSTIASNVLPLKIQYTNSSAGISSYNTLATKVKKYKTEYEFHVWSYNRKIKENDDDSADQIVVAGILTDPVYGGPY